MCDSLPEYSKFFSILIILIQQAFQSFDPDYKGRIRATDFRRVLDNFCFPLSEPQFKHLLGKLTVHADNQVDYTAFVGEFMEPDSVSYT